VHKWFIQKAFSYQTQPVPQQSLHKLASLSLTHPHSELKSCQSKQKVLQTQVCLLGHTSMTLQNCADNYIHLQQTQL
jgi:hypothetical protein